MHYEQTIFENEKIRLMVNYSGVKENIAVADDLKLHLYAFDKNTSIQIFEETLDINHIRKLYGQLNSISVIRDSLKNTSSKFIETNKEVLEIINSLKDVDPDILMKLLVKFNEKDKRDIILSTLTLSELNDLSAAHRQQTYKSELEKLVRLLKMESEGSIVEDIKSHTDLKEYEAGQPEKIFQNWIEKNLWVFGVDYIKKHDERKIAIFSEGDLLMESMDGFLDLIELKRPKLDFDIFKYDNSHKCYYPSSALSKVIGQCLFYLQLLDDYKLILEKEYKVKLLRPRIKIILGRTDRFENKQFEALRMLNSNLNHIQIISYDYLLSCGRKIISAYE